jgi:hypothetical protein
MKMMITADKKNLRFRRRVKTRRRTTKWKDEDLIATSGVQRANRGL